MFLFSFSFFENKVWNFSLKVFLLVDHGTWDFRKYRLPYSAYTIIKLKFLLAKGRTARFLDIFFALISDLTLEFHLNYFFYRQVMFKAYQWYHINIKSFTHRPLLMVKKAVSVILISDIKSMWKIRLETNFSENPESSFFSFYLTRTSKLNEQPIWKTIF